jgi:hypothetical protein
MSLRLWVALVVMAAIGVLGGAAAAPSASRLPPPLYVSAARLFDGVRFVTGGASVEVREGRIAAAGKLRIPKGAKVTRLGDATIMPGHQSARARVARRSPARRRHDDAKPRRGRIEGRSVEARPRTFGRSAATRPGTSVHWASRSS